MTPLALITSVQTLVGASRADFDQLTKATGQLGVCWLMLNQMPSAE